MDKTVIIHVKYKEVFASLSIHLELMFNIPYKLKNEDTIHVWFYFQYLWLGWE